MKFTYFILRELINRMSEEELQQEVQVAPPQVDGDAPIRLEPILGLDTVEGWGYEDSHSSFDFRHYPKSFVLLRDVIPTARKANSLTTWKTWSLLCGHQDSSRMSNLFDVSRLKLQPLQRRKNRTLLGSYSGPKVEYHPHNWGEFIDRINEAKKNHRPIVWFFGAHATKLDLNSLIVKLIEKGNITHLATNGAGLIHDAEIAMTGATSEHVDENLPAGTFGLWKETLETLDQIADDAFCYEMGLGESAGKYIQSRPSDFPYLWNSLFYTCTRCQIPATCHVAIGCDITVMSPQFWPEQWGAATYRDFLIFARTISELEGGVFINVGSSVMGPEVFQKALSMARNVAHQEGRKIENFTTAVFDLQPYRVGLNEGPEDSERYYFRPGKTLIHRAAPGNSFYFQGDHRDTIPALVRDLC